MSPESLPRVSAAGLVDLTHAQRPGPCAMCAPLVSPGWESLPSSFDTAALQCVGTLRREEVDDPTVMEHHPRGTHAWSPDAPIAPAFFPYNRCDVWTCRACARPFLRYTEYGGYYEDARIRAVSAALVEDASG